jgi:Domain of unknown function (DUF2341)/Concanavalin A-like lectin/glucanases superfamily
MHRSLSNTKLVGLALFAVAVFLPDCSAEAPAPASNSHGTGGTANSGGAPGTGGSTGETGGSQGTTGGAAGADSSGGGMGEGGLVEDGGTSDAASGPFAGAMQREVKLDTSPAGAGIGTDLVNYPVPVQLNKDNFDFGQAKADGSDIRFTKADGSPLPYEIELWDAVNKVAAIWVKTTVLGNNASQSFVMHWGDPAATSTSDAKAVFPQAESWVAVWHLGDDAESIQDGFKDATGVNPGTGHHLEKGSSRPARMGLGTNLDYLKKQGVKVVENRANFDLAKNITFEIWGFLRSFGYDKGYESYMTKGDESWRYMRSGRTSLTEICSDGEKPVCVFSKSNIQFQKWYHFAGVHEGRAVRLYVNGVREDDGNAGADHVSYGDHAVTLGFSLHKGVEQRFMDMIIDEARVTRDSKTDDWIKLDYESLREGSTFVTLGPAAKATP